ncbi:MAG: DUF1559 domain-containing protein [Planctomycetaceae bacterium]
MSDPPDPKPQGLWGIMKRVGLTASTSETVVQNTNDDDQGSPAPKGLWKVMGLAGSPPPSYDSPAPAKSIIVGGTAAPTESQTSGESSGSAVADPAMRHAEPSLRKQTYRDVDVEDERDVPDERPPTRTPRQPAFSSRGPSTVAAPAGGVGQKAAIQSSSSHSAAVLVSPTVPAYGSWKGRNRQATVRMTWMTGGIGLSGLLASTFSYLESFWFRIPATIMGLVAMVIGLIVLSGAGRANKDKTMQWIAGSGMACGLLGMFLGPLVFSGWGMQARREAAIAESRYHLEEIGSAIEDHHAAKGRFPAGGTFVRNKGGPEQGTHGWMTELLPYIGKADLYSMIEFQKAYDDPANFAVFSQSVPTFFASGGDQRKIGRGLAVSHFAAIGGTEKDENGRLIDLGIFGANSDVRRPQVTDGLSQTIVVGEVGYGYPAWGEPENWRQIGKGLNREPVGFGNSQDTGAVFLFGDGSVKFFSNDTDPEILRQLSTRNGNDGPDAK